MRAPTASGDAPPVLDREEDDQAGDQQREERREADQEEVERVDAWRHRGGGFGKERGAGHISCGARRCRVRRRACVRVALAAHHDADERRRAASTVAAPARRSDAHDDEAVAARHRVVVIAVEQQRVDGRADLALRRLDERQAQVARAVLDAEEVAREPAVRRHHDDAGRMRELLGLLVPGVAEAGGAREPRRSTAASPVRKCQPRSAPGRS